MKQLMIFVGRRRINDSQKKIEFHNVNWLNKKAKVKDQVQIQ